MNKPIESDPKAADGGGECPDRDVTGLCDEAQADGVPCFEAGRDCQRCDRARPEWRRDPKKS